MEQKVFFEGEFGKICGVLHKYDENSEIVIIVHGFSSNKDSSAAILARSLNEIDINAIRIDFNNRGESELDFEEGVSIPNYIKQIESTIDYCKSVGYNKISLVGTSFGGIVAFSTAAKHPELNRLLLRVPVVDFQKHLERRYGKDKLGQYKLDNKIPFERREGDKIYFNYNAYESAKGHSMKENAHKIEMPTLIIQGTEDEALDWTWIKDVIDLFPNAELKIIEGADHSLSVNGDFSKGLEYAIEFFKN